MLPADTTVVFLDNNSFSARTVEGRIIPCRRKKKPDQKYHVNSDLVRALAKEIERQFGYCKPILDARAGFQKLFCHLSLGTWPPAAAMSLNMPLKGIVQRILSGVDTMLK
jgi:hypothetical protein